MVDKEREALRKGYSDRVKHAEHNGIGGAISELFGSTCYQPPRGREEAYKEGWKLAERDIKEGKVRKKN